MTSPGDPGATPARIRWSVTPLTLTAVVVAIAVAVVLSVIIPPRLTITGIADAPQWVQSSVSGLKALRNLAAALAIGWLAAATILVPPQLNRYLDVGGYRAMRAAAMSATVWCVVSFALVPITAADQYPGQGAGVLSAGTLLDLIDTDQTVRLLALAALFTVPVAVAAWFVLRISWATVLLGLSLLALFPIAAGGHASGSSDHDIAVDTMIWHLLGATLWIGGLIAVVGLARQRVRPLATAVRRYSTLALVALGAVALSGLGNAVVRLERWNDLWNTDYGRLVVLKTVAVLVLGLAGLVHRRRTIPALEAGRPGALIRFAAGEVLVMAATVGLAVGLSRTAPPPPTGIVPSIRENILGFDLTLPPTAWRLLTEWRIDWLLGPLTVAAVVLYLWGVVRLRRRGDRWPPGRTIAWLLGCLVVLLATSSGLAKYGLAQFSVHMIGHMMLGMFAPVLLVLGAPTTLLLRVLPAAGHGRPPGLREAVVAFLGSRLARIITHPLVVFFLFIGSFFAVYFTGLFAWMMGDHLGHLVMNVHFLLVGYLYYWVIIGIDPTPHPIPYVAKLGILLGALPFHAFFGIALMSMRTAMDAGRYADIGLPWVTDLVADQQTGGGIAWGITEAPMLIVLVALLAQWSRDDERRSRREDRHKDTYGDQDLEDYNRMLAGLAARDESVAETAPPAAPNRD